MREGGKQERRSRDFPRGFPGDNPDLSAVVHTSLQTNGCDYVMLSVECPFPGSVCVCVHAYRHVVWYYHR